VRGKIGKKRDGGKGTISRLSGGALLVIEESLVEEAKSFFRELEA